MTIDPPHPDDSPRLHWGALALIVALLVLSHATVWNGQFGGEDEVMQLDYAVRMMHDFRTLNVTDFFRALASQSHPPLRYWLSMPGLLLVPNAEFGVRLGAILFSCLMTYLVVKLGTELGGARVGLASGMLVAVSPVFNWTSLAFGWSVTVCALLLAIRILRGNTLDIRTPAGRRGYRLINLLVIVAFLINTGNVLFFASTCLVYFIFNWRHFWRLVWVSIPFVLFFLLYYTVYLFVVPYVGARYFGITTPVGQFHQNMARAGQSYLNITSLIENLQGINGYFVPYVAWVLLAFALYYLVRRQWVVALWLSPFLLAWSFFLTNQSHQYFLLVFIAMLPFGVKVFADLVGTRTFTFTIAAVLVLIALWNYQVFLKPYGSDDPAYPYALIALANAHITRVHNITEPYGEIAHDIEARLGDGEKFIHDLEGSFTMFYYPSPRYAGLFGGDAYPYQRDADAACYHAPTAAPDVRAIVTVKEICGRDVAERIVYPKAAPRLYLLKAN